MGSRPGIGCRGLIGRQSGGRWAILSMFNIARRRRPIGRRTCTTQLRVVINKNPSPHQPGSRTILYDSLIPDGIPGRVLKECCRELAEPVTQLYSLSFRCGVVPTMWKFASVIPVYKKPPKSNPCNYRPVPLLPILSKIMEAIVNCQLVSFLDRHHLLPDSQYGFRQGRGTADVLTAVQHEWTQTIANGGTVPVVAVDIAGAFDRVSHSGIVHKV